MRLSRGFRQSIDPRESQGRIDYDSPDKPLRACVSEESDSSPEARWTLYHIPEELMVERSRDRLGVSRSRLCGESLSLDGHAQ